MKKYSLDELRELMKSFYLFSGIRFILFDSDYQKIVSFPENDCAYCSMLKQVPSAAEKCLQSDKRIFKRSVIERTLVTHSCHSGLLEAAIALYHEETPVGYLMFGQVAQKGSIDKKKQSLIEYGLSLGLENKDLEKAVGEIVVKTEDEIHSAAKIMEACTSYIIYKELIRVENSRLFELAKEYIDDHICEDIQVSDLANELQIGRTRLYDAFSAECDVSVGQYIRRRRMHYAKKLISTTDTPITQIAEQMGFNDYNYFGKAFKKHYGVSPKSFRDKE